jgi:hypothetical protein
MSRKFLFIFLFLIQTVCVFAQLTNNREKKIALGGGLEWNMNSRENFAGGAVIDFDYNFDSSLTGGVVVTVSSNFTGIAVIEPAAMFRWYFLSSVHNGLFAQADAGVYLVVEEANTKALFLGGLRAGIRLPLGVNFFIEPFGRIGYPFAFGIGVLSGINF